MNTVSIIIGTYGDQIWVDRAQEALKSARQQTTEPDMIFHVHADTLAEARNKGARMSSTRWLIFCDADDTLDRGYVEAMVEGEEISTLRQPSTLGVYPDGTEDNTPVLIPERPLLESNYLVIGSMCLREQFLDLGGFNPSLPVLEDWDLWLRMSQDGALIGKRPDAIYRIGVNPNSRNQERDTHTKYYNMIRSSYR